MLTLVLLLLLGLLLFLIFLIFLFLLFLCGFFFIIRVKGAFFVLAPQPRKKPLAVVIIVIIAIIVVIVDYSEIIGIIDNVRLYKPVSLLPRFGLVIGFFRFRRFLDRRILGSRLSGLFA